MQIKDKNYEMLDLEKYHKALDYASTAHSGQMIKGTNNSYVMHLSIVVMEVICAYLKESNFNIDIAITISLLHDVIEDTERTLYDIEKNFGKNIADAVNALTKDTALPIENRLSDSIERIKNQPKEVAIVKIADRISNLYNPPSFWSPKKRMAYCNEAKYILKKLGSINSFIDKRLDSKIKGYNKFL